MNPVPYRHIPSTRQKGVAAVEMAIVLPLLVLVFGGMIEYGRLMWHYDVLAKATRDAARFLSTQASVSGAANEARERVGHAATAAGVKNLVPADHVAIRCLPASGPENEDCTGTIVRITVRVNYPFTIGEWVPILGSANLDKTLSPHTTMPYMR